MRGSRSVALDEYREFAAPGSRVVVCTWLRHHDGEGIVAVVPDGCVDLIWRSDGQFLVAGADTTRKEHAVDPGLVLVGVRLRTGCAGAVMGQPMTDLLDHLIPVEDCWGRAARVAADRLRRCPSILEQREQLMQLVETRAAAARLDMAVMAASESLATGQHTTASLIALTGVAGRQLRRRFAHQVGYGPKTFERIARLHRARAVHADSSGLRLAAVAAIVGYADQAHLARDSRAFFGVPPSDWATISPR